MQIASPFALSILGVTSLYIAPLLLSPHGREAANQVAHDSSVLASDIANKAVDHGKSAIDTSKFLANSAVATGKSAVNSGKSAASSAINQGQNMANATADTGKHLANSTINQGQAMADSTVDTTKSAYDRTKGLATDGMNQAADQTYKARDTIADTPRRVGVAASNVTGFGKEQAMDMKNELEDQSNYVVGRGDNTSGTSSSSVPRASHRAGHPSEPSTAEDSRKAHVYSDPLSSRR